MKFSLLNIGYFMFVGLIAGEFAIDQQRNINVGNLIYDQFDGHLRSMTKADVTEIVFRNVLTMSLIVGIVATIVWMALTSFSKIVERPRTVAVNAIIGLSIGALISTTVYQILDGFGVSISDGFRMLLRPIIE
ncbi:MAG: hypothetical protein NT013_08955 [Planctomycetia bacterium]|nr:hypothetical protein [Planctomycetia bacterium]